MKNFFSAQLHQEYVGVLPKDTDTKSKELEISHDSYLSKRPIYIAITAQ